MTCSRDTTARSWRTVRQVRREVMWVFFDLMLSCLLQRPLTAALMVQMSLERLRLKDVL